MVFEEIGLTLHYEEQQVLTKLKIEDAMKFCKQYTKQRRFFPISFHKKWFILFIQSDWQTVKNIIIKCSILPTKKYFDVLNVKSAVFSYYTKM